MNLLGILLVLSSVFAAQQSAHSPSDIIEEDELRMHLAKQNECEPDQIYFWTLEQFDFLGKGYDQAAVVASTCMTGTTGPDVHSVFTRDDKGELKELAMEEVKLEHRVLFGNSNSGFRLENGLLVDVAYDTSDRDEPLVIKYKWDPAKQMFAIVSVVAAKRYATSYDCDKAEKDQDETAQAICYVETLADLDVDLAKLYKAYLAGLNAEPRKAAIAEQRAWLKKRNQDCVIYKWWVDCLTDAYKTRIAELKKKMEQQKKPPPGGSASGPEARTNESFCLARPRTQRRASGQRARAHAEPRAQRRRYVAQKIAAAGAPAVGADRHGGIGAQPVPARIALRIDALHGEAGQILH